MYKRGLILTILLSISCTINAQLMDSLNVKENTFYNYFTQQLWETPLFFTSQKLSNYTQTQIHYKHKDLHFKRTQTAETTNEYGFSTEGIFNIKPKLRLFGNFDFIKTYEKNLGYNFTSQRTENQNVLDPNYFFAPQKGDWEIQKYALNGGMSYQLSKSWLLGATVFYKTNKSFRTNDPRPELSIDNYGGTTHAGYSYKNHTVFASGGWSKNTETSNIIYVNDNLNAPVYTNTFTRYSSGYGRVIFNSTYGNYLYKTIDKNFGIGYQYQTSKNYFQAYYNYSKSMQDFYRKDANGNIYFDDNLIAYKYRLKTHQFNLNYMNDGSYKDYLLKFNYQKQQGDNFSVIENGQNYKMLLDTYSLTGGIIKNNNTKTLYSTQFTITYKDHSYIDLLGYTNKQLKTLDIGAFVNKDIYATNKNVLNLGISANYYSVLNEHLLYSALASDTSFANDVIFPDHAFDVTSKLTTGLVGKFKINLPKRKSLTLFIDYKALIPLNKKYKIYSNNIDNNLDDWIFSGITINY